MKKTVVMTRMGSLLLLLLYAQTAFSYDEVTHRDISKEAAKASALESRLPDIGQNFGLVSLDSVLSDGGYSIFGYPIFETKQKVIGWIRKGAFDEDAYL